RNGSVTARMLASISARSAAGCRLWQYARRTNPPSCAGWLKIIAGSLHARRRARSQRNALVDEQDRDAVDDRIERLAVLAHEPGLDRLLHRGAAFVGDRTLRDARVERRELLGRRFLQPLARGGAGQHREIVLVDHASLLRPWLAGSAPVCEPGWRGWRTTSD